jgi:hypothetical protein
VGDTGSDHVKIRSANDGILVILTVLGELSILLLALYVSNELQKCGSRQRELKDILKWEVRRLSNQMPGARTAL